MRSVALILVVSCMLGFAAAQRRRPRGGTRPAAQPRASRELAGKYSSFLHSSNKHKSLSCSDCHKIPTTWTANREFPDAADFPDHDACVRCHRSQFFTRQAIVGAGPAICTVCHIRAAPREAGRFGFGKPNVANQTTKPKDERQFVIRFPHDKHQNVIGLRLNLRPRTNAVRFVSASFAGSAGDEKKSGYNDCVICHTTLDQPNAFSWPDGYVPPVGTFKTHPSTHDSCFNCHWKNVKPVAADCGDCHIHSPTFVPTSKPERKSLKFRHEGGGNNPEHPGHVRECTTCHINITRVSSVEGLTPDVPISRCADCHVDAKKITFTTITTIQDEIKNFQSTGECKYCHTSDVGKKKAPPSHQAAAP